MNSLSRVRGLPHHDFTGVAFSLVNLSHLPALVAVLIALAVGVRDAEYVSLPASHVSELVESVVAVAVG